MTISIASPFVDCIAPDWASGWGQDQFGYFAEFSVKVGDMYWDYLTQRMRWVPPGTFKMGTPTDKTWRSDDEIPRQVTISDGFWIADTTCTQEMWAAVMGNNPSEFKGEKRPVEMVSHTDALEYCDRLNTRIPSLNLRLPTEGEWEYACRSGTDTAFSFGNTISSDQVNFNGNFPMEGMPKSEYRRTTIDCKSMLPNAWGLYQMHGNVSEWCQDWYGDYDPKGVMDPTGPSSGSVRVVRGGGWVSGAGSARSAYRGVGPPSGRGGGVGFRCLSSVNPSAEQASATKSEPRDEAAEERRAQ